MLHKYYEILGIQDDASVFEIKQAFRNRAKELHPDINKSQNAHQQFILLVEAYEYLINQKTGTVYARTATNGKSDTARRWQDNEAARARHRAEYYSKVNFEKFINSDYYKTVTSLSTIFEHLGFFIGVGILIPVPVILILLYGPSGVIISLFAVIITLPLIRQAIKSRTAINIKEFFRAIAFVTKTRDASIAILSVINLFVLLKIGLQTMIPLPTLLIVFSLAMSFVFFFTRFDMKKTARSSAVISFCYCPFLINLLLLANFLFTTNPGWEVYSFRHHENNMQGNLVHIDLENNRYRDFSGIRIFADYDSMKDANKIAYKFEDGLLGFRVMKEYKFYK